MESWEAALERFIRPWRARRDVVGVLVYGSRVAGTADQHSDIDVIVVLSNRAKWREHGLKRVGGYTIEYFAQPIRVFSRHYTEGLDGGSRSIARMFTRGRFLFDRGGSMARMRRWATRVAGKPMKHPDRKYIENAKYSMWDAADGLASLKARHSPSFWYAYYLGLDQAIESYRKYLGAETPAQDKMWDFVSREDFRRRYGMQAFPDRTFAAMVRRCLEARTADAAHRSFRRLVAHAQRRMGGFRADSWRLRMKAD